LYNSAGHMECIPTISRVSMSAHKALSTLVVLSIYIAIFLKDALQQFIPLYVFTGLLGISVVLGCLMIISKGINRSDLAQIYLILYFTIISLASFAVSQKIFVNPYLIAPIVAFTLVKLAPRLFFTLLIFHLFLSLGIQISEMLSGTYFFIYISPDGTALDEVLFAGNADVLRTKGLFQGPLSATGFGIWLMFLFKSNVLIIGAAVLVSIFAYGRLGMAITVFFLMARLLSTSTVTLKHKIYLVAAIMVITIMLPLILVGNNLDPEFFLSAFSLQSAGNLARIFFWSQSLALFLSFDIWAYFLGSFGAAKTLLGSTENDFLRILLDGGVLAVLPYISTILLALWGAFRRKHWGDILIILLIIILMNAFPFIQSLTHSVLFWCFFFLLQVNSHASKYKWKII